MRTWPSMLSVQAKPQAGAVWLVAAVCGWTRPSVPGKTVGPPPQHTKLATVKTSCTSRLSTPPKKIHHDVSHRLPAIQSALTTPSERIDTPHSDPSSSQPKCPTLETSFPAKSSRFPPVSWPNREASSCSTSGTTHNSAEMGCVSLLTGLPGHTMM